MWQVWQVSCGRMSFLCSRLGARAWALARVGVDPFPIRVQLTQWLSVCLGGPLCRARWGVTFGVCVVRPSLSTWIQTIGVHVVHYVVEK